MADRKPQNFKNHRKFVPLYHFFALGFLLIYIFYSLYQLIFSFSLHGVFTVLLAFTLIIVAFYVRAFATGLQDRIILLEEKLRYQKVMPADLKSRFDEFSLNQIISLRFASDEELPGLAKDVLEKKIDNRDEIKKKITQWRADYNRV